MRHSASLIPGFGSYTDVSITYPFIQPRLRLLLLLLLRLAVGVNERDKYQDYHANAQDYGPARSQIVSMLAVAAGRIVNFRRLMTSAMGCTWDGDLFRHDLRYMHTSLTTTDRLCTFGILPVLTLGLC